MKKTILQRYQDMVENPEKYKNLQQKKIGARAKNDEELEQNDEELEQNDEEYPVHSPKVVDEHFSKNNIAFAMTVLAHCKNVDEAIGMVTLVKDQTRHMAFSITEDYVDVEELIEKWMSNYEESIRYLTTIKEKFSKPAIKQLSKAVSDGYIPIADIPILL